MAGGLTFKSGEVMFNTTAVGGFSEVMLGVDDSVWRPLADGSPDPGFVGTLGSRVIVGLSTYDIENALTYASPDGYPLTGAGFKAWNRNIAHGSTRTTTGGYLLTVAEGMVVPRRLSAAQGVNAQLAMEVIATNANGAIPFTYAANTDAFNAPTQDVAFTLGKILMNGSALADVQSIDLDFGIQVVAPQSDGLPYPKKAGIIERLPILSITTMDIALPATILAGGYAVTQIDAYLRNLTVGASVGAAASSLHIKMAGNVGMACNLRAGGRPGTVTFDVPLYAAGGTAMLILTPDQAIP